MLTQEELKRIWNYDLETGLFTRLVATTFRTKVGQIASPIKEGRVVIRINKILYQGCRLAFLYVNGKWPTQEVDHINGLPSDNRWCNLRDVSHALNLQNLRNPRSDNASGYLGVHFDKQSKSWKAEIFSFGKRKRLGSFNSAQEASLAYIKNKRILHESCSI